ncbi:DUF4817 domain-containing protein [Trichonephila clavipes]|nr:DUF4817 domain-containing protein [Trichonephila clavipes]
MESQERKIQAEVLFTSIDGASRESSDHGLELVAGVQLWVRVLEPPKTCLAEGMIHIKSIDARNPHICVVWKYGNVHHHDARRTENYMKRRLDITSASSLSLTTPISPYPSYCTIASAVQRLNKTGSCHRRILLSRPTPSSLRILAEDVLGYVLTLPESSVRDISKTCSYSKSAMWNILHTYGVYSYRPVLAQELMPGDQERRFDFCNFVLNTLDENPDILNEVLWSDECQFSRHKVLLIHRIRITGPSKTHI